MLEVIQLLSTRNFGLQDGKEGEREIQRGGTSGNKQEAGVGAQAEGWRGVESRRPASSTAFGLKTTWRAAHRSGGSGSLGSLVPSPPHFLSLCQHLRPYSHSRIILGILQEKKRKKQLFLELILKEYDSAKGSGEGV